MLSSKSKLQAVLAISVVVNVTLSLRRSNSVMPKCKKKTNKFYSVAVLWPFSFNRQNFLTLIQESFFFERVPEFTNFLNGIREMQIAECNGAYLDKKKYWKGLSCIFH